MLLSKDISQKEMPTNKVITCKVMLKEQNILKINISLRWD